LFGRRDEYDPRLHMQKLQIIPITFFSAPPSLDLQLWQLNVGRSTGSDFFSASARCREQLGPMLRFLRIFSPDKFGESIGVFLPKLLLVF
jgi:hypothetical protein